MSIVAFAEEVCWKGDVRRPTSKEVVFRVTSIGKIDGRRVDFDMSGSFDIWWDPDDESLLDLLTESDPGLLCINWDRFVFWRKHDHSAISIIDPADDSVVGSIVVRKRLGGDPSGEIDWTNVVMPIQWRKEV
jgi:hypothetical protein